MAERMTISVAKAVGVRPGRTPEVAIIIAEQVPDFANLDMAAEWYEHQAQMIEETLYSVLPGGTYDHLAGAMLRRKGSHFRVAYGDFGETPRP